MRLAPILLGVVASAALAAAALAQGQGRWSAIAVGPKGTYGVTQFAADPDEARAGALEACGETCTQVFAYNAGCASVAATPEADFVGFDYSKFLGRAEFRALRKCAAEAETCEIVVTACARPNNFVQ
jgi:hypothetical protein